jgi:microcystin-dependent protein
MATTMSITNQTNQEYWFGPLHLPAGVGTGTLVLTDPPETLLYNTNDTVADAINTLYTEARITVTVAPPGFPRATGVPQILHGDGSPEGVLYAGPGSLYLRRDNSGGAQLYQKVTGPHVNTDWSVVGMPTGTLSQFGGASAPTGWLLCDGSSLLRSDYTDLFGVIGTTYGAVDGSHFNLPDLRGRVAVGLGPNASVNALNANEGQSNAANRSPYHRTSSSLGLNDPGHVHYGYTSTNQVAGGSASPAWATPGGNPTSSQATGITLTGSIGTNNANDAADTPSFIVVNFIIKT